MTAVQVPRRLRAGVFSGFAWPLPDDRPGAWVESEVDACRSGIHACRHADLPFWLAPALYEIELGGPSRAAAQGRRAAGTADPASRRLGRDGVAGVLAQMCIARAEELVADAPELHDWAPARLGSGRRRGSASSRRIAEELGGLDAISRSGGARATGSSSTLRSTDLALRFAAERPLRTVEAQLPGLAGRKEKPNEAALEALAARAAATLAIVAAAAAMGSQALAGDKRRRRRQRGSVRLSGLLPRDHLTVESAIQVDLSKESVRLPLYKGVAYKGTANGETVWFLLLDASDQGIAHDLGVNYAPKLGNLAIGDPEAVQTVTLDSPTPDQNRFGQAVVDFQGAPDFSPTRIAEPGPTGFPLASFQPGAVAGPATARSSASPARRPCTARRSSRPATARSTSSTTRTPATACSASTSPARRRPGSSRSRGSTCCS